MFQFFGETFPLAISRMSGFLEDALNLQDHQDRAFRVASSLGTDISLDEPILDSSDLWFLRPSLMAARAHHAPPHHEEDVMRTEIILLKPRPY